MIDISLLILVGSFAVGGWLTSLLYVPKEERDKQIDLWLAMGLIGLVGYKLTPLLFTPSLLLKPVDLWLLNSGDIGLMVGGILALLYFGWKHRTSSSMLKRDWVYIILLISFGYTIASLIRFEVYEGRYLGLYRGLLGLAFLHLMKWNRSLEPLLIPLYIGGIVIIESFGFARLYGGFSFIQWFFLLLFLFLLFFSFVTKRRNDLDR